MNKAYLKKFLGNIKNKKARIAVVGLGYVGLPLAVEFSRKGFTVVGIDVDRDRIRHIEQKKSYISDISDRQLNEIVRTGRFSVSGDFSRISHFNIVIICVPTPLKRRYHPDISYIEDAVASIAKNINRGSLVILESTTYPGTTEEVILPMLEKNGLIHDKDFYLCFSPERIDPGNKNFPIHRIPKVIGGVSKNAAILADALYSKIVKKVIRVSSARTAEAVKLLENTFRLVNISLVDELAMMAHKMNIDIWEVIAAASTKPFGFMAFSPGPGVGGHCIPKDPLYLYWKAKHFGFRSRFIKLASDIINFMPEYVVWRVEEVLKSSNIKNGRVLVIGVTYKKDVKDLRKSPALDVIEAFKKKKIKVSYHDPLIPSLKFNQINLKSIELTRNNLRQFHCVVITTDHTNINYGKLLNSSKRVFDTRNVFKGMDNQKVIRL